MTVYGPIRVSSSLSAVLVSPKLWPSVPRDRRHNMKREAVGKVVSVVLPRINPEGQPALPLLPSIAQ